MKEGLKILNFLHISMFFKSRLLAGTPTAAGFVLFLSTGHPNHS